MSFYDYEICFKASETNETFHDVLFCSFIRTPIIKQASYCLLNINLTPIITKQILNDINNNNYPRFNLTIYIIDKKESQKRIKNLFDKNYIILNLTTEKDLNFLQERISCKLLLVNPILYYMNSTNTYNTILENKTCLDSIKEYENFIKKTYGDTFFINRIGEKTNLNQYIYEQILIKTKNDLNVPTELINVYKPYLSPNFYFFDDFNLNENNDKDITCHHINLYNKNDFNKLDIVDYKETHQGLKRLKEYTFSDLNNDLDKEEESININHQEIKYKSNKNIFSKVPNQNTLENKKDEIHSRNINFTKSDSLLRNTKQKIPQSSQHTIIYTPDTENNAEIRYKIGKEILKEKIENIVNFQCTNCLPDWLQFGNIYNLEIDNLSEFTYTPLNIINIFSRKNSKEHYLSHYIQFNCIKFFDNIT